MAVGKLVQEVRVGFPTSALRPTWTTQPKLAVQTYTTTNVPNPTTGDVSPVATEGFFVLQKRPSGRILYKEIKACAPHIPDHLVSFSPDQKSSSPPKKSHKTWKQKITFT